MVSADVTRVSPAAMKYYLSRNFETPVVPGGRIDVVKLNNYFVITRVSFDRVALVASMREYLVGVARARPRDAFAIAQRLHGGRLTRALVAPPPLTVPLDDGNVGAMREVAAREVDTLHRWIADLPWSTTAREDSALRAPGIFAPLCDDRARCNARATPAIDDPIASAVLSACGWRETTGPDERWIRVIRWGDSVDLVNFGPPIACDEVER